MVAPNRQLPKEILSEIFMSCVDATFNDTQTTPPAKYTGRALRKPSADIAIKATAYLIEQHAPRVDKNVDFARDEAQWMWS